jgi:hypothetical protein
MEQLARAEPSRSRWRREWPAVGLAALLAVVLVLNYRITLWALGDLLAAPLALLALPALLLLPGLALLRWLWPHPLRPIERWPLAIGIGAGLPPLLFLIGDPIGLRWNGLAAWAYLGLSALALAWPAPGREWRPRWRAPRLAADHAALIALTLVGLALRLYVVRDLPAGMFGDSYHHTIIAQLLIDNGGLFTSWHPYAPLKTFTYHFGFHSLVAMLHWLAGVPAQQGVLLVGQAEIALAAPLVYVLARRMLGDSRAALWAAVLAGFASAMPGYYVNWGRYTQLAGQTVLPAACLVWAELLDASAAPGVPRRSVLRLGALAAIVTAGLALTHYRVAVFAACFVVAYGLQLGLRRLRAPWALLRMLLAGGAAGAATGLLVLPWIIRLRQGRLLLIGNNMISSNMGTEQTNSLPAGSTSALITPPYLVALALAGVALLAWRRNWRGLALVGWAAVLALAANPYLVGLNGAGILSNFAVLIAIYLLLAPLGGLALAAAARAILPPLIGATRRLAGLAADRRLALRLTGAAQLLAGLALLLWAIGWQQNILDRGYQLLTPADAAAMSWIQSNTPPDAKFLVNGFPAFGSLYAGSDGGWWLPFLTGRASNLPPITYGTEAGDQPDLVRALKQLNLDIQRHGIATAETAALLRAQGFSYLYDGPAASPPPEFIDPAKLAKSPYYTQVYRQGGVTIWRINPAGAQP